METAVEQVLAAAGKAKPTSEPDGNDAKAAPEADPDVARNARNAEETLPVHLRRLVAWLSDAARVL